MAITYTVTVRRTVEEDIDYKIDLPEGEVDLAVEQALELAKVGFDRTKVIVTADVIGNIHGSDGSLWI